MIGDETGPKVELAKLQRSQAEVIKVYGGEGPQQQ